MQYRKRHIRSKIHKIRPKKSMFKRPWFWIIFLFIILVLPAFYFILFYSGVQIKNIVISGNQKVASQDIENLISNDVNNKLLGIGSWQIDSKSIFLINSDKLGKEILNKFPTIENVKIDRKFMQTLAVAISERVPFAVFCPSLDKTIETQAGKCYFIDDNGVIFEPLYVIPQNILIILQAMDNSQVSAGKKVVQQNIMDLLSKVGKDLKDNFQISLKEAAVTSSLRLDVTTNENWKIYFNLSISPDVNSQLTKLNLLLKNEVSGDQRKNLRYIDLRPEDRAIVCDNKECGFPH